MFGQFNHSVCSVSPSFCPYFFWPFHPTVTFQAMMKKTGVRPLQLPSSSPFQPSSSSSTAADSVVAPSSSATPATTAPPSPSVSRPESPTARGSSPPSPSERSLRHHHHQQQQSQLQLKRPHSSHGRLHNQQQSVSSSSPATTLPFRRQSPPRRPESVYGRNLSADAMRDLVRQQIDLEVAFQRQIVESKIDLQKREMLHELSEFVKERNKEREERMRQVRVCLPIGRPRRPPPPFCVWAGVDASTFRPV